MAHDRVVNQSLAVQNQMMASKIQRTYSQVQHIVQDFSPSIKKIVKNRLLWILPEGPVSKNK
jgi:hypothetical protein